MEHSEQMDVVMTSVPILLRRTHSLDIHSNEDDSSGTDLELDTNAAHMLEYLDDYEFLDEIANDVVDADNIVGGTLVSMNSSKTPSETTKASKVSEGVTIELATQAIRSTRSIARKKMKKKKISRRVQILDLRNAVRVLNKKLDALKNPPQELIELIDEEQNPALWKHVAMRQFERRRKAEDDNTRLRDMLTTQTEEAKCLQRILKRRAKIQLMEDMLGMKRRKHDSNLAVPLDNSQIFMKLIHEIDESFRSYFGEFSIKKKQKMNRNVISGLAFETTQCHKLPFSLHHVKKSAWSILKNIGIGGLRRIHDYNKLVNFDVQHCEESSDTIAISFFSATPGIEDIGGAQIRKVMRAYVEKDRTMLIWKMLAEPKLEGSNLPAGYQVESTLQIVMQPSQTSSRTGSESTQLLIHFSGSRIDLGIPTSSRFRGRGHMEISIGLWEKLISRIPSEIESEVIDNTCGALSEMAQEEETHLVAV